MRLESGPFLRGSVTSRWPTSKMRQKFVVVWPVRMLRNADTPSDDCTSFAFVSDIICGDTVRDVSTKRPFTFKTTTLTESCISTYDPRRKPYRSLTAHDVMMMRTVSCSDALATA